MASATPQQQQKDAKATDQPPAAAAAAEQQKSAAALEEDDEFEDFPVEGMRSSSFPSHPFPASRDKMTDRVVHADWEAEDTEAANGGDTQHLWEESWDDDDTSDDFSAQLRYVVSFCVSSREVTRRASSLDGNGRVAVSPSTFTSYDRVLTGACFAERS